MRPAPLALSALEPDGQPDVLLETVDYPAQLRQPGHRHRYSSVTLHLAGGIREWARQGDHASTGLSISVKPAGTMHADLYGPAGARTFQLELSPAFDPGTGRWHAALGSWRWIRGGPAVSAGLALFRATREAPEDGEALAESLLALLDALGRRGETGHAVSPPCWLARVLEYLREGSTGSVRLADAARVAGVHPVHLARVFRRYQGCTISDYLRRLRVERAAALLARGSGGISQIAQSAGFADQSHLTRQFRRETGLTPALFRRLASGPTLHSFKTASRLRG